MNESESQFIQKVHEVTQFCLDRAGKCFGGWSKEAVFIYVAFHALSKTLFVMRVNGKVSSVAFAWPTGQGDIERRFGWSLPKGGDVLMVRELIGSRRHCAALLGKAYARWPHARRVFAFRVRNGAHSLREINCKAVSRFVGGQA